MSLSWFCSLRLLRLWRRRLLLLLLLWFLICWSQNWRVSLGHLNKYVSARLFLLPIRRIVHRPPIVAVSCTINYSKGGSGSGGGAEWAPWWGGITIEDKVGYFKAEKFT